MTKTKHRLLTLLLAFLMIITSLPLNVLAASGVSGDKKEITDIKTVGDKQVINLGEVQEKSSFRFFSRSARLYGARTQQAGNSDETVPQNVEIKLETMGLNLEDPFDGSALDDEKPLDKVFPLDVTIKFVELGATNNPSITLTFQKGDTSKKGVMYLPKNMGQGNWIAEIPKVDQSINLRVYNDGNGSTNFNGQGDMTYTFSLTQIVHPVIDLKVVDPYGKELQENINQDLGLKLTLEDEHEFNLPANTKSFNIRTLDDFTGYGLDDLNSTGANPTLSLTTAIDANKRLKVGEKTYKLNKITYAAQGQEVEINGQKQKVGGYIEFATQPKIVVPTPDENGDLPTTPDGYKRLSFRAESSPNAQDGRFENGEKLKVIDVLEGTEYTDQDLQKQIKGIGQPTPIINGRVDDNKKFLKWKPELPTTGPVADTDYYPVYLANGGEITPGEPLPDGVFEVKVIKDDTIAEDALYGKSYGVFQGSTLARDKFPDLVAAAGHQNPKWTTEADAPATGMVDIVKPWTKEITKATTFKATAGADAATQIKKEGLKAVDTTALQGQDLTEAFWHKGVALADNTPAEKKDTFEALLKDATVTDKSSRTTAAEGTFEGTLLVTFKDGSTLEVPNQKLIVKPNTIEVSFDNEAGDDANAPRHKETVVKGKVTSTSDYPVKGAKVEIKDEAGNVIGITLADENGNFTAGTRELKAGEKLTASVTLPDSKLAAESTAKTVKLNPDRLNELLPIAKAQKDNFSKKQNAIIKERLKALEDAIKTAGPLVDANGKATATDTADNQTAIDNAVKALEDALKALTANIPPSISGPKTHEIFVGEDLDLKALVDVTDGDGAEDLVVENGSNVKITAVKVDGQTETPVTDLSTIKDTVGTYKATYTAKDKSNAEVTHVMELTVKPRTTSAIEVTTDPTNMSYLITEKDGKAKLNLEGMTLNLVDNLGKKTKVELTDPKVKFKVNEEYITDGGDLTLADDVKFIEVEYTPEGSQTPLTAKTDGVLRVGPDYDKDGKDDRTQNFDPDKIEKLEVIKQPQLDYIAKDKSEDSKFKLNLEGMIVRMTDKAGKEKLAIVKQGKFYDYDEQTKEITQLTATPAHGATLTPETSATETGDNGKTVKITGPNNSEALTEPLKVFYDANGDGTPDHNEKTPAPSAMARNVGENPQGTTVEGMATPGAVIKITDKGGTVLTTEPTEVKAGPDGKYSATVKPILADGTDIKVTAKLGEMGESDPTPTTVFDDKNDNKQPDRDEGFNIEKATDIKFVDQPDLTYLVPTKDTEVTFDGKDGKGKAIYLELSYKNGDKTESKIMTLEDLMKDTDHISVTPAKGTTDKIGNDPANLVGKAIDVKLVKVDPATATSKATSESKFAIKVDANNNGIADEEETTDTPTVTARNIGTEGPDGKRVPATKTTVEIETVPKAKVTIEYTDKDGQPQKIENLTAGEDGKLTQEITPKLKEGTDVKVTVQDGEKKPTDKTVKVFDDLDDNKIPDNQAGQTERPAAIASNKGKNPTFTTIEGKTEKGATITVTLKDGTEVKVDEFNIDADGNYTLQATVGGKPLENGAEIFVYAENAPKTISKPQTTTVFNDVNKDGKPDGGKVDLTDVKDIQVIAPDKMSYTQGEKLVGTGLKAVVRDNKGGIEIFDYDNTTGKFKDADGDDVADITATVANKAIKDLPLTAKDHNGKAIDVKAGNMKGSTNQTLEVKQLQTPTPTIEFAANQNTVGSDGSTPTGTAKQKTTVKFTVVNKPTTVYVKYTVNGEAKEETVEIGADDELTKTVDLAVKLPIGSQVQVLAKDADKTLSEAATAKVVRDANNDGTADDKTPVGKSEIDPIKAQSESITVKPADNATELVIKETDKSGNTPEGSTPITVTKDKDGNWKIGDTPVEKDEETGKLTIPTKDKLKLDEYNVVEVESKGDPDTTTPSTAKEVVGEAADTTAPDKPVVDAPIDGDKDIKVKTPTEKDAKTITVEVEVKGAPGEPNKTEKVVVVKDGDGKWKIGDTPVKEENGKLVIPVDPAVKTGDKVTVEVKDDSGNSSKSDPQTVVERETLPIPSINPIKTGEKTVAGKAENAATVDIYKKNSEGKYEPLAKDVGVSPDGSYTYNNADGFNDGDVIRVVAKKPGMTEAAAEATVGVDTSGLDKAITDGKGELDKRNDGTPEDKALEDAIKKGEEEKNKKPPKQEDVDKAQKDIEKAIEDKKAADEARDKLQEKINEANDKKNDPEYPNKPDDVKKELDEAAKDGQKVHDDSNKSKEDIDKEIKKIQEKIDQYNKQQIGVNIDKIVSTSKDIKVTVTASNAKVEVFKVDFDYDTLEDVLTPLGEATSITRLLVVSLDEALPKGTNLLIKVTHPDYLSYEDNITVE